MNARKELESVLAAINQIIHARNANPEPCHYAIREAIDASREVVQQAEEELEAEDAD